MPDVRVLARRAPWCLALSLLLSPAAGAEVLRVPHGEAVLQRQLVAAPATAECAGGLVNDSGSFDGRLSFHGLGGTPADFDVAMLFVGPGAGRRVEQVCVCWQRALSASDSLEHEIRFYRADGPGGGPGSLLSVIDAEVHGIGTLPTVFGYDVTAADVVTPASGFFVGVRWSSGPSTPQPHHAICSDSSSPPVHPIFFKPAELADWFDLHATLPSPSPLPALRSVGIRVELAADGGDPEPPEEPESCAIGACSEDDDTLCLAGGRFEVEAGFDPPNDADDLLDPAQAHPITADTGTFTFFDPGNVEAVVKVLAACPVNQHHWVFAAGLTNVLTEIRVCDKETGTLRRYTNPQGTPFQPIQDTAAFATCP